MTWSSGEEGREDGTEGGMQYEMPQSPDNLWRGGGTKWEVDSDLGLLAFFVQGCISYCCCWRVRFGGALCSVAFGC